jgi:hypothetical protein
MKPKVKIKSTPVEAPLLKGELGELLGFKIIGSGVAPTTTLTFPSRADKGDLFHAIIDSKSLWIVYDGQKWIEVSEYEEQRKRSTVTVPSTHWSNGQRKARIKGSDDLPGKGWMLSEGPPVSVVNGAALRGEKSPIWHLDEPWYAPAGVTRSKLIALGVSESFIDDEPLSYKSLDAQWKAMEREVRGNTRVCGAMDELPVWSSTEVMLDAQLNHFRSIIQDEFNNYLASIINSSPVRYATSLTF